MRILIGHNLYQKAGGEDAVVSSECELLKKQNHDVFYFKRDNKELANSSLLKRFQYFSSLAYSKQSYNDLKKTLKDFRPHVVHFHNIYYLLTPSVYFTCKEMNIPVVQSLHNFRMMCINGLFLREQQICEKCLKGSLWNGVKYKCFRNSRIQSFVMADMLRKLWKQDVWHKMIDAFIVASTFTRNKYIQKGISADKLFIKPNFVYPDPEIQTQECEPFALFVGRLSHEKGVNLLLKVWRQVKDLRLVILGTGPMEAEVKETIKEHDLTNVDYLGYASKEMYEQHMSSAKFVIVPSQCYENFPRIVAESYFFGKPVVASRLGSLQEVVRDQETGLLFDHKDENDLLSKINQLKSSDQLLEDMKVNIKEFYQQNLTSQRNYKLLMNVYNSVIQKT